MAARWACVLKMVNGVLLLVDAAEGCMLNPLCAAEAPAAEPEPGGAINKIRPPLTPHQEVIDGCYAC